MICSAAGDTRRPKALLPSVGGEPGREFGDHRRVLGRLGEIACLLRIAGEIEQLPALAAFGPFHVAPAIGPHGVPIEGLRERRIADGATGCVEHRHQAQAIQRLARREAGQVGQRGIEVEQLHKRARLHAAGSPRSRNHEGHAGIPLKKARLLPESVIGQVIAMVAGEHHDRVVPEAEAVERVQHDAHLRVHVGRRRVVRLDGLASLRVGHLVLRSVRALVGGLRQTRAVIVREGRQVDPRRADTGRSTSAARRTACAACRSRPRGRRACARG